MQNSNADRRLLLGTSDWEREDWLSDYYPPDLPSEWRLAYYANDCGCVLLKAARWADADTHQLAANLEEAELQPVIFLQLPAQLSSLARANLALFGSRAVLLVDRPEPEFEGLPQWVAQGTATWVDPEGAGRLSLWWLDGVDLRGLRARAEQLPESTAALVLDGPGANPGRVAELRILLELMGKAGA